MKLIFALLLTVQSFAVFSKMELSEKVNLLYLNNPESSSKQEMTEELTDFCRLLKSTSQLNHKKQIKAIVSEVEKSYLVNNTSTGKFNDLKKNKAYNPVTAAILYAIIFDELAIPHTLNVSNTEIKLLIYPNSDQIELITTTNKESVFNWSEAAQMNSASYLINDGRLSQNKALQVGYNSVCDTYFFEKEQLNFKELASFYYVWRSFNAEAVENYAKALDEINYALSINKNKGFEAYKGGLLYILMEDISYTDIEMASVLLQTYDLSEKKTERERLLANFQYLFREGLMSRRDTAFCKTVAEMVPVYITNKVDEAKFMSYVHFFYGYAYERKANYIGALDEMKIAYALNDKDYDFNDFITHLVILNFGYAYENDEVQLTDLNDYFIEFPFLENEKIIKNLQVSILAEEVANAYFYNNHDEGKILLDELMTLIETFDFDATWDHISEVALAFSEVGTYYYREKDYKLATYWINKAYELDPDDDSILTRKAQIEKKAAGN